MGAIRGTGERGTGKRGGIMNPHYSCGPGYCSKECEMYWLAKSRERMARHKAHIVPAFHDDEGDDDRPFNRVINRGLLDFGDMDAAENRASER